MLVKFCCVSRNQRKKRNVLVVVDVVVAVVVSVVVVTVVFGFWVNVNVNVMRPARLVWSGLVCSVWPVSCRHHLLYDLMYVCLRRTLKAFHKGHKVAETLRCPPLSHFLPLLLLLLQQVAAGTSIGNKFMFTQLQSKPFFFCPATPFLRLRQTTPDSDSKLQLQLRL